MKLFSDRKKKKNAERRNNIVDIKLRGVKPHPFINFYHINPCRYSETKKDRAHSLINQEIRVRKDLSKIRKMI